MLTIKQIERAIKIPVDKWKGACYGISKKVLDSGLVKGKLRYGHWLNTPAKGSIFSPNRPFQRHGWIEQEDGTIVDVTRWVFENKKPYIFISNNTDEYDAGGQRWRTVTLRPPPPFDKSTKIKFKVGVETKTFILAMLGHPYITKKGLFWIANLPIMDLAPYAEEIYLALDKEKLGAFVPIDNYKIVTGKE